MEKTWEMLMAALELLMKPVRPQLLQSRYNSILMDLLLLMFSLQLWRNMKTERE